MTIDRGDGVPLIPIKEQGEQLYDWIEGALESDPPDPTHVELVNRLNAAINRLARTAGFDMRDLTQLLKDVRDKLDATTRSSDDRR